MVIAKTNKMIASCKTAIHIPLGTTTNHSVCLWSVFYFKLLHLLIHYLLRSVCCCFFSFDFFSRYVIGCFKKVVFLYVYEIIIMLYPIYLLIAFQLYQICMDYFFISIIPGGMCLTGLQEAIIMFVFEIIMSYIQFID